MSEKIYDDEIAPLLLQAAQLAEKHGIALVCFAQWSEDGSGHTATLAHDKWPGARIAYYAAQCSGNADSLIMALMRDGHKYGHNSICLSILSHAGQ